MCLYSCTLSPYSCTPLFADGEGGAPSPGPTSPATTSALEALLPPDLQTYSGGEGDRKAKVEWRKRREEAVKKLRLEQ